MIRKYKSSWVRSEKKFSKLTEKHDAEVRDYIDNNLVYDFLAFYVANAYNNNAIWKDYRLDYMYNGSLSDLTIMPEYEDLDLEKLNKIMKEKYSLKITSTIPIKIEKTQSK